MVTDNITEVTVADERRRPAEGPLVISIDCSTTGSKAIIVDVDGRTLAAGASALTTNSPQLGRHEQDAASWWPATETAIQSALSCLRARHPGSDRSIKAICVAHQRETFVLVDKYRRALHPAILWLDARASAEIAEFGTSEVEQICGKPADITPALYKIIWLRRHHRELVEQAHRLLDTHAYLVHALTGTWATSRSSADPLALLDISNGDYSAPLLDLAGLAESQLPPLHDAGEHIAPLLADLASAWGLASDVVVVAGLGDGQAAGLGSGVLDPSTAYLNAGTALLLGTERSGYAYSRAYRSLWSVTPGQTTLETFLSSGTYLPTWFRRRFGDPEADGAPDPLLEAAATQIPAGSEGLLTLPFWNAAQTPHWDPRAAGTMLGWRGAHGRAHAYRSLLEGIAQEARLQLEGLESATGIPVSSLRAMGGGMRSPLFAQVLADVLERPLHVCAEPEISGLGAAVTAMVSIGAHPDLPTASRAMTRTSKVIEPDASHSDLYGQLRDVHRQIYPQLRAQMHTLHEIFDEKVESPT